MCSLVRCIYRQDEKNELIDKLIDSLLEFARRDDESQAFLDRAMRLITYIAVIAPFVKDQAFESEEEWRILIVRHDAVSDGLTLQHRDGKSMLLPYIELPLPLSAQSLRRVVVGPTPHPALSKDSAEEFLRSCIPDFPDNRVVNSKVPFRDW
jgi:hypothetical protein